MGRLLGPAILLVIPMFVVVPERTVAGGAGREPATSQDIPAPLGRIGLAQGTSAPAACDHLPRPTAPATAPNDNRTPAGELRDGVLTLGLVVTTGTWYPDGPDGCGIEVHAFAEDGTAPAIPGPLLRVTAGTELRIALRNDLADTVWLKGLEDRPVNELARVRLLPGASHEFRFRASTPGTYYYAAGSSEQGPPWQPSSDFGPLVGAFIVDAPDSDMDDRVFVLTRWSRLMPQASDPTFETNTINGLSWPQTERLLVTEGKPVRWRVINPTNMPHLMHLHGFYFRVLSLGTETQDRIFAPHERPLAVTEFLGLSRTMSLEWTPQEVGNWIFHCHLVRHMTADQRLDRMPDAFGARPPLAADKAGHAMAGLIMGVTVEPLPDRANGARPPPSRRLRLFANERAGVFGDRPGFAFVLQEGESEPAPDSMRVPGSPLLLTRGEPTEIVVRNRTSRPLAVHWHGIELESYFDGVAGWSGIGNRLAPATAPGDSFAVRITPKRAGTFIYHIHNEQREELASGLYGPLLVLPPGQRHDAETDLVFLLSDPGPGGLLGSERPPLVNGKNSPEPVVLRTGTTYRMRFIDISSNDVHIIRLEESADLVARGRGAADPARVAALERLDPNCRRLRDGAALAAWRAVARDGADHAAPHPAEPACLRTGPGSTFDFEFTPAVAGERHLEVQVIDASGRPGAITTVTAHVAK
jgi:FtsP/CotA-like multicopper oxidase with cupredoxin domain